LEVEREGALSTLSRGLFTAVHQRGRFFFGRFACKRAKRIHLTAARLYAMMILCENDEIFP